MCTFENVHGTLNPAQFALIPKRILYNVPGQVTAQINPARPREIFPNTTMGLFPGAHTQGVCFPSKHTGVCLDLNTRVCFK